VLYLNIIKQKQNKMETILENAYVMMQQGYGENKIFEYLDKKLKDKKLADFIYSKIVKIYNGTYKQGEK
tara:strand:+ start:75 stop:281 length:207 start_codon:yes stop_codon:yes gene_type:complete